MPWFSQGERGQVVVLRDRRVGSDLDLADEVLPARLRMLLQDRDFRVQAAAVEALNVIGDPAAIGALQRMIDRELDGRLRRRGKEVIRDLGEGAPLAEDVRRLRDEVGELRALAASLRERVELLESRGTAKVPAATKPKKKKR